MQFHCDEAFKLFTGTTHAHTLPLSVWLRSERESEPVQVLALPPHQLAGRPPPPLGTRSPPLMYYYHIPSSVGFFLRSNPCECVQKLFGCRRDRTFVRCVVSLVVVLSQQQRKNRKELQVLGYTHSTRTSATLT